MIIVIFHLHTTVFRRKFSNFKYFINRVATGCGKNEEMLRDDKEIVIFVADRLFWPEDKFLVLWNNTLFII